MRKSFFYITTIAIAALTLMTSCEADPLTEKDVFNKEGDVEKIIAEKYQDKEYKIFTLNEFVDEFMTEQGNFWSDTSQYRTRALYREINGDDTIYRYLFSIDTIPTDTIGLYIRGRISTDDYGGNFYKALVIQQVIDGKQQNLRISVDMGSAGGMFQIGQEILIRCNGLCIGRYGDQPQLCVPAYNNNIFAANATQKVGWAPGRIPSSIFKKAVTTIGAPNPSKLKYDVITITDFINIKDINEKRTMDGRLVTLTDVWFTGQYTDQDGNLIDCTTGDPEHDQNANVFAPTTGNIGFPQSRVITDGTNKTLVSSSEYSKFAYFYLPGADSTGVANCAKYKGTITGILGQFRDNGRYDPDQWDWSITPRNIKINDGSNIHDIVMINTETGNSWIPTEYTAPKTKPEINPNDNKE